MQQRPWPPAATVEDEIAAILGQPPWNAEAVEAEAALGAAGMR